VSADDREYLTLKWGVPKSWHMKRPETQALLQKYASFGWSSSGMAQPNTADHKRTLCELIDALDADTIGNDWTGEDMSKDEAKKYVMEYGQ